MDLVKINGDIESMKDWIHQTRRQVSELQKTVRDPPSLGVPLIFDTDEAINELVFKN